MFGPVRALARFAERTLLRSLDAVLTSALAQEAVDRVLGSVLVEKAVATALRGPLVDAVARDLVSYRVIQRVAEPVIEGEADELEQIVAAAVDTPAARRLVAHVIESGVVDEAVARLLESEELWILVDEVARSPAVTDAISHQGAGLAEQVAGVVRERSRDADAGRERLARRVVRRHERTPPRPAGGAAAGPGK